MISVTRHAPLEAHNLQAQINHIQNKVEDVERAASQISAEEKKNTTELKESIDKIQKDFAVKLEGMHDKIWQDVEGVHADVIKTLEHAKKAAKTSMQVCILGLFTAAVATAALIFVVLG